MRAYKHTTGTLNGNCPSSTPGCCGLARTSTAATFPLRYPTTSKALTADGALHSADATVARVQCTPRNANAAPTRSARKMPRSLTWYKYAPESSHRRRCTASRAVSMAASAHDFHAPPPSSGPADPCRRCVCVYALCACGRPKAATKSALASPSHT